MLSFVPNPIFVGDTVFPVAKVKELGRIPGNLASTYPFRYLG